MAIPARLGFVYRVGLSILSRVRSSIGSRRRAVFAVLGCQYTATQRRLGMVFHHGKQIAIVGLARMRLQPEPNAEIRLAERLCKNEQYEQALWVAGLYQLVHGRRFDVGGMLNALDALGQGVPLATLVANAFVSEEFMQRGKPSPKISRDIDIMFRDHFFQAPPSMSDEVRARSVPEYAAQLLLTAEVKYRTDFSAIYEHCLNPNYGATYRLWLRENYDLDLRSCESMTVRSAGLPPGIAVSFVMAPDAFRLHEVAATLTSIERQICDRYELVVAGSKSFCNHVTALTATAVALPVRDKTAAFNEALEKCRGKFVLWLAPGVQLSIDAVFHLALAAADGAGQQPVALFVDGDAIDGKGRRYSPRFALGWDMDAALSQDRWSQQILVRTDLARSVGGARQIYPGYTWADLALRAINTVPRAHVYHIPRPLISIPWHLANWHGGWAGRARSRSWSRLVANHLAAHAAATSQPPPRVVRRSGEHVRVIYPIPREKPLVSIVIPTRDKSDLLNACLNGLLKRTEYAPLEILLVDNRSVEPRTQSCLARYALDRRVRIFRYDHDFNWGAINNFAVSLSNGSIVLLLNNDTEVIDPGWLDELVAQALRPEVGAVGAKLLYRDGTVQHAGLIFGPDAQSFHRFRHMPGDAPGYGGALATTRQVSAVTGACLALRRSVYDQVGGIEDKRLSITWSDVDLCFRVREHGYRVIYAPHVRLRHLELATRGPDDTPELKARAERERLAMLARWPALASEDAHYNPNLHLGEWDTRVAPKPRLGGRSPPHV